ncbi:MAG: radical SAM family heme chaperone HemW [Chlamydiia bacterium]|nr:radical SAM family heme chaperone HemW [Chlamydiia bacterium]
MVISLYFHLPFCTKKCDYCHFFVLPDQENNKLLLLNGLRKEWELLKCREEVATIYFGGGTPSLFGPERIAEILSWIPFSDAEVTLEVNPETVTKEVMAQYKAAGINRISLGIQSFSDRQLKILSRTHDAEQAIRAIDMTHAVGFDNITIDLMYDLPHQTLSEWEETLSHLSQLPITHLSLYNLTIEPHTVFFKHRERLTPHLPQQDVSRQMLLMARDHLCALGFTHYEISAFAKPCYPSRHNSGYWTGRPFWGLGPSASSFMNGIRSRNVAHLGRYLRSLEAGTLPIESTDPLPFEARRRELLTLNLRLLEGVHLPTFEATWGPLSQQTHQTLNALRDKGWLHLYDERIALTEAGLLFHDSIAIELI